MAKINFEEVLAEKRKVVWQEVQKYLQRPTLAGNLAIPQKYKSVEAFHWQLMSEYPRRLGKYLRPALVLLTAEAMGVPEKKAIRTAAAMQTSEDWILIHDDFEDGSLMRRGKPALHHLYGPELAVNASDGLQVIMWKMLWDNCQVLGEEKAARIAEEFYQMLTRTVLGQTVEIKWTQENNRNLTDEDVFFIMDGKTVYYSIAGPMRLGAILAGASPQQLATIYEFARPLGRCFQIVDDLLDLTSDFQGLKKQQGNDIYEGKRTIMLLHLFRTARGNDKKRLVKIMAKTRENKTAAEVKLVIRLMEKYDSLDYGQKLAAGLAEQALAIFEKKLGFLKKAPARQQIQAGVDFILRRNY